MKTTNRRKKYLIYPDFQIKLIALHGLTIGLVILLFWGGLSWQFHHLTSQGALAHLPGDHSYFRFLQYQKSLAIQWLLTVSCVGLGIYTFAVITLSNRLAGPIVRLKEYFQAMSENGKPTADLEFRKGDFFQELPQEINNALKGKRS